MSNPTVPAAAEGMPETQTKPQPVHQYGAILNLANLMAMAHWHFLDNMTRVDDPDGSYWRMNEVTADQGLSLLYVADKFGADTLAAMRRESAARNAARLERGKDQ